MTIKRQYSLPNCKLVLEGLENNSTPGLISILVNAECHFENQPSITGGKVFFEHLLSAVNAYAQEFLSGLPHPQTRKEESDLISIVKIPDHELHRLTWQKSPDNEQDKSEIDLSTVQFFDLVEAIDQFSADSSTLPELTVDLEPLSQRYRLTEEPTTQKVIPLALGVASLAIVAIAVSFLPIPEVRRPEPQPQANPTENTTETIPIPSPTKPE